MANREEYKKIKQLINSYLKLKGREDLELDIIKLKQKRDGYGQNEAMMMDCSIDPVTGDISC